MDDNDIPGMDTLRKLDLGEHNRIGKENARLQKEVDLLENEIHNLKHSWRNRVREVFWRGAGWGTAVFVLALTVFGVYWGCFRGSAWGLRARQNAEREAVRYAQGIYPGTHLRAICEEESHGPNGTLKCQVFGGSEKLDLNCDDDEPFRNDGCTRSVHTSN
jgi:hypothetical protein